MFTALSILRQIEGRPNMQRGVLPTMFQQPEAMGRAAPVADILDLWRQWKVGMPVAAPDLSGEIQMRARRVVMPWMG